MPNVPHTIHSRREIVDRRSKYAKTPPRGAPAPLRLGHDQFSQTTGLPRAEAESTGPGPASLPTSEFPTANRINNREPDTAYCRKRPCPCPRHPAGSWSPWKQWGRPIEQFDDVSTRITVVSKCRRTPGGMTGPRPLFANVDEGFHRDQTRLLRQRSKNRA